MGSTTSHTPATPYHRIGINTTQTAYTARLQQSSGELWRAIPKNGGGFRTVQAYRDVLSSQDRGIEFVTPHAPTKATGTKYEARWLYCEPGHLVPPACSPDVLLNGSGYAVLRITVTKVVP